MSGLRLGLESFVRVSVRLRVRVMDECLQSRFHAQERFKHIARVHAPVSLKAFMVRIMVRVRVRVKLRFYGSSYGSG